MPIPFPDASDATSNVFISDNADPIGGVPEETDVDSIKFATPNMIYDIAGDMAAHNTEQIFLS